MKRMSELLKQRRQKFMAHDQGLGVWVYGKMFNQSTVGTFQSKVNKQKICRGQRAS